MKTFDAAIIGAGPAGSAAAIMLARRGYAVALVDKQKFPREKLCGDFVSPINFPIFLALGVEQNILAQPHARISAFRISSPGSGIVEIPLPEHDGVQTFGIGLSRAGLDHVLLQQAMNEGVTAFQSHRLGALERMGSNWRLIPADAEREEIGATVLIGADGRNSWLAERLGLRYRSIGRPAIGFQRRFESAAALTGRVEIHLFPGGYAGMVGIGENIFNICASVETSALPEKGTAQFVFEACLPRNPYLKAVLERSTPLPGAATAYPVYFPPRRCYGNGFLLAGDAARVNEPVSGEGVYFALKSGVIAAKVLDEALRARDTSAARLAAYARECKKIFRMRRSINALIRYLVYRPELCSPLIRYAARQRRVFRPLMKAICTPDAL